MNEAPESTLSPLSGLSGRLSSLLNEKRRRELMRFIKFGVVGAIGAVIDFSSFNALNALGWLEAVEVKLPVGATLTGVGVAATISFVLAIISNFIWNRYWTYPDSRSRPLLAQFLTFFGINVAGLLIRVPLLESLRGPFAGMLETQFSLHDKLATDLGNNIALALAVIAVMFWNFFINRYITYSDVD